MGRASAGPASTSRGPAATGDHLSFVRIPRFPANYLTIEFRRFLEDYWVSPEISRDINFSKFGTRKICLFTFLGKLGSLEDIDKTVF